MTEYRPREMVRLLGVSPATLRSWSSAFADHLSARAGGGVVTTEGRGTHRTYNDDDVLTLRHAKALLAAGGDFAEARNRLHEPWTPIESPADALIAGQSDRLSFSLAIRTFQDQFTAVVLAKDEVLAAKEQTITAQTEAIIELRGRLQERDAKIAMMGRSRWRLWDRG